MITIKKAEKYDDKQSLDYFWPTPQMINSPQKSPASAV